MCNWENQDPWHFFSNFVALAFSTTTKNTSILQSLQSLHLPILEGVSLFSLKLN